MDNNNNLKERRKALGLRLRDLAEKSGVSYGSVWNYEHGRADHAIVNKYKAVIDYLDKEKFITLLKIAVSDKI